MNILTREFSAAVIGELKQATESEACRKLLVDTFMVSPSKNFTTDPRCVAGLYLKMVDDFELCGGDPKINVSRTLEIITEFVRLKDVFYANCWNHDYVIGQYSKILEERPELIEETRECIDAYKTSGCVATFVYNTFSMMDNVDKELIHELKPLKRLCIKNIAYLMTIFVRIVQVM